jgi:hypothetical protein
MSSVAVGKYYTLKPNQHVINEQLYVANGKQSMVQQVVVDVVVERKKKLVQFALISDLLS